MLGILLIGVGSAYAVYGVADDVPGRDVAFPIICIKTPTATNQTDTGWAIADAKNPTAVFDIVHNYSIHVHLTVHEPKNSAVVKDDDFYLTPNDVLTGLCSAVVATIDPTNKAKLEQTINDGTGSSTYYVGYAVFEQQSPTQTMVDTLVSWVYLTDLANGYASGFNGVDFEGGVIPTGGELEENGKGSPLVAIAANHIYPRYVIQNNLDQTRDWWILLFGRADLATKFGTQNLQISRSLNCDFWDEQETHGSNHIPIPNELDIINVADYLTVPFTSFPHNGFASCVIGESGTRVVGGTPSAYSSTGTMDSAGIIGTVLPNSTGFYSFFGWSHQKVQASSVLASWDVINPIHRTYCSGVPGGPTTAPDNLEACTCTGGGC